MIAQNIQSNSEIRLVLIAGPSSSGKTTFSKRLSIQLIAAGIKPVPISMDDYFVDREQTPLDEKGSIRIEHPTPAGRLEKPNGGQRSRTTQV